MLDKIEIMNLDLGIGTLKWIYKMLENTNKNMILPTKYLESTCSTNVDFFLPHFSFA